MKLTRIAAALAALAGGAALLTQLSGPAVLATYTPAKPYLTLNGVGAAPACPSGFIELIPQTAAGSFAPITSLTTTAIAPLTAITTWTASRGSVDPDGICIGTTMGQNGCGALKVAQPIASGGTTTSYNVASAGATTTYTFFYRVCTTP
jgi:hypothetical protein